MPYILSLVTFLPLVGALAIFAALYFVRASDYVTGQELEVAGGWNL